MPVERRGQAIRVMIDLVNWQQEEPTGCGGGRQLSMDGTSRVSREAHARFCERLGVQFPGATRLVSRTRRQARCCARDEGRSFGAALWEEASNCRELLRSKAAVVNVSVKRRDIDHVMYGLERRTQVNLR